MSRYIQYKHSFFWASYVFSCLWTRSLLMVSKNWLTQLSLEEFFWKLICKCFISGCYKITTVFSHAQTVVLCVSCSTVLCQPTGGRARLTEGKLPTKQLNILTVVCTLSGFCLFGWFEHSCNLLWFCDHKCIHSRYTKLLRINTDLWDTQLVTSQLAETFPKFACSISLIIL